MSTQKKTRAECQVLTIHKVTSFWGRLRGLHAYPSLTWHTGLCLVPCNAIHTFGLSHDIDVVFLDKQFRVIRQIDSLAPCRVAICLSAVSVVELAPGYCRACPGYAHAIGEALQTGSYPGSFAG